MTSDCGWGCTIRCAQMLIANAILRLRLMYRLEIVRLFDDSARGQRPSAFSIQNIAVKGLDQGKLPGDWYGVNATANVIQELNEKYRPLPNFKICVFNDGNIICDLIDAQGKASSDIEAKMANNLEMQTLT
jgi:hypothetical protein